MRAGTLTMFQGVCESTLFGGTDRTIVGEGKGIKTDRPLSKIQLSNRPSLVLTDGNKKPSSCSLAANWTLPDYLNPHKTYNTPNIFNRLRFKRGYPALLQTVKNRKKDPSFQLLTSSEILYLAWSGPMVLR